MIEQELNIKDILEDSEIKENINEMIQKIKE